MAFEPQTLAAPCHRFKPSGKWYDEIQLDMSQEQEAITAPDAVEAALVRAGHRLDYFSYVVIEPAHPNAYPVMIPARQG